MTKQDSEVFKKLINEAAETALERERLVPTGSYEDPFDFYLSSELYKIGKEQGCIDENDMYYDALTSSWGKVTVRDINK